MRPDGWQQRFLDEIARHEKLPSEYGTSDCFQFAMDVAAEITQKKLKYKFNYSNKTGAAKIMKNKGWKNVGDAFASYFDEIPPSFASRGDIGIVDWDGEPCGVVILGTDILGRHPVKGTVRLTRMTLKRAFRVE